MQRHSCGCVVIGNPYGEMVSHYDFSLGYDAIFSVNFYALIPTYVVFKAVLSNIKPCIIINQSIL